MLSTVIYHPGYFYETLKNAGYEMPEEYEEISDVHFEDYPHANLFLKAHTGVAIDIDSLDENAKIIKNLTVEELKIVAYEDLERLGCVFGNPNYIV